MDRVSAFRPSTGHPRSRDLGSPIAAFTEGPGRSLLLACVLVAASAFPASGQSSFFIRGDVNHDGLHSIADLTSLIHYTQVGSNPPPCLDSAGLDDNGMINILDVSLMMSLLFFSQSNTAPTPAPFPTPGLDPTDDKLSCFGPLGGPDVEALVDMIHFSRMQVDP